MPKESEEKPTVPEIPEDEITLWIQELGDDERAAEVIWDHFFTKIVGVAKQRMNGAPRADRDEEDVALSAMDSFFRGANRGELEPKNRGELWRLLVTITRRKVRAEHRKRSAQKRRAVRGSVSPREACENIVDKNPMPELEADVRAACRELIESLEDRQLQRIAILKMEGHTNQELAEILQCSIDQVKYRLSLIKSRWSQQAEERF